ncbi:CHASE2 domain-containing protein [Pantanalinema sp. GBBB05]|uniref:CHASE2 domain-containing protein n=1 Tax=Pantanalinema sp. GBBB05 TaxID=2604139 RepID=UPI001E139E46|nr:CHASE2 domain-containing protein [Pantanalinema sp. GBBB05]
MKQQHSHPHSFRTQVLPRLRKIRAGYLLVTLWALSAAIVTGFDLPLVRELEQQTQNWFFRLRGTARPPEQIVIVAIDGQSLLAAKNYQTEPEKREITQLLQTWPWPRTAYAKVIERLMAAGAKTIALDLLMEQPSGYGPADDQRLQQTIARFSNQIVLAAAYEESSQALPGAMIQLTEPTATIRTPMVSLGLVNYLPNADGQVARLGRAYHEDVLRPLNLLELPTFAEATLGVSQIPYPPPQGHNIFFYGKAGTVKQIPFWQVLAPDWWQIYQHEQTFKDKIVIIGTTDSTISSDMFATPFGIMSGVEIHANEVATLLEGRSLIEPLSDAWIRGLFVFIVVAGTGWLIGIFATRLLRELAGGIGILVASGIVAYLLFTYSYIILPTAVPLVAIALSTFSYFTARALAERIERIRLRSTMERYIAAPVVQEILKYPGTLQVGRKLKAAVLFSDIRGFTTLSYKLPPEQLIEQLNIYFSAMVQAIIEAGGTVDKFIGDAIMAEFGFPLSQGEGDDALNAIRAALGMRAALADLRSRFIAEGRVPFFSGIGISYGEVIAGDIGALRRREYGVIGDTVNVASRVEGMTKQFGTDILITESLYILVADKVEAICMGEHELRGRANPIALYSLVGWKGEDQTLYHQTMEELRNYLGQPPSD